MKKLKMPEKKLSEEEKKKLEEEPRPAPSGYLAVLAYLKKKKKQDI